MRIIVLFMLAALALPGQEQKPDLEKQEKPAVTQEASEPKAEGQQKSKLFITALLLSHI
jgi:hypothetical protein